MWTDIRNREDVNQEFNVPPNGKGVSLYNGTGAAVAAGDVVMIDYEETATGEMQAITPATSTFCRRTAVAMEAIADGDIGYFQIEGECEAFVEGTTDVAAGDSLEVLSGENEWKKDGSARAATSGAVAIDAQAENENVKVTVFLIPEGHTIA